MLDKFQNSIKIKNILLGIKFIKTKGDPANVDCKIQDPSGFPLQRGLPSLARHLRSVAGVHN